MKRYRKIHFHLPNLTITRLLNSKQFPGCKNSANIVECPTHPKKFKKKTTQEGSTAFYHYSLSLYLSGHRQCEKAANIALHKSMADPGSGHPADTRIG